MDGPIWSNFNIHGHTHTACLVVTINLQGGILIFTSNLEKLLALREVTVVIVTVFSEKFFLARLVSESRARTSSLRGGSTHQSALPVINRSPIQREYSEYSRHMGEQLIAGRAFMMEASLISSVK